VSIAARAHVRGGWRAWRGGEDRREKELKTPKPFRKDQLPSRTECSGRRASDKTC